MDAPSAQIATTRTNRGKSNKKQFGLIGGAIVALIIIALAGWYMLRTSTASVIDTGKYQAVFFTNGQVYFGKLSQLNSSYFKLTNVFYIQAQNSTNSTDPQKSATDSGNIQLIKLGSEVHGPDDEMVISRDQVLFFENLKKDGKVSDSITKYNADHK